MNKKKIIAIILLIAFIGMVFAYKSFKGEKTDEKVLYHCPMHPTYISDRPGDCPICNMKLVKMEGHEGHTMTSSEEKELKEICIEHTCTVGNCQMQVEVSIKPGEKIMCPVCGEYLTTDSGKVIEVSKKLEHTGPTVNINPEMQQIIGIKTGTVMKMDLRKTVRASGRIAYDPELVVVQQEFIQALITEDKIKDSPLDDVRERARYLTEASRTKLRLLGLSEEQILELENTRDVETSLYLPGKGEGVWAYISIYEYEIGLVKIGQDVEIESVAYPGEIFSGKVVSINPVLDPMTRTNQIRVGVANPESKLKPEMFITARINISLGERLAVPESAVMDTGLRKIVFLSREGGVLESREIRAGQKAEGFYEVISGISEGDIVVTSGNFFIDAETRLKTAISGESHMHGQ